MDYVNSRKFISNINNNITTAYQFTVCDISIKSNDLLKENFLGKKQKINVDEQKSTIIKINKSKDMVLTFFIITHAPYVNYLFLPDLFQLLRHYNSSKHKGKIKCFCTIRKTNSKTCTTLDKKCDQKSIDRIEVYTFLQINFKFCSIIKKDLTFKRKLHLNNVNLKV